MGRTAAVLLSIVTITYRDPDGLRRTLDSLAPLAASPPGAGGDRALEHEILVVDSSPEETRSALLGRAGPLRHLPTAPRGVYAALNEGVRAARGEVVWLLNGGDALHGVRALEIALDCLRADRELGLVVAGAACHRRGRYLYSRRPAPRFLRNLVGWNHVCHQAVLYRREALRRAGEFSSEHRVAGDYHHHYRCWLAGLKVRCIPEDLVDYDMDGGSGDVEVAFASFESVHRALAPRLPGWLNALNHAARVLAAARVRSLKRIARSGAGPHLISTWLAWNRLKHGARARPRDLERGGGR